MQPTNDPVNALREAAHPLTGSKDDYDGLLELIGDARFVLLGEASHGTHEFYRERSGFGHGTEQRKIPPVHVIGQRPQHGGSRIEISDVRCWFHLAKHGPPGRDTRRRDAIRRSPAQRLFRKRMFAPSTMSGRTDKYLDL
jgi:hypothetical protein